MRDRKKLLSIILVFAMVLQMAFPTYADTRTVRRTLTKTTTTYTTPTPEDDPILVSRINF